MTSTAVNGHQELIKSESICKYKWNIYNFLSFEDLPTGEYICSQTFEINDLQWNIKLYPNGYNEHNKGYFSIFLQCLDNIKITVNCEITMSNNEKVYESDQFYYTYEYDPAGVGYGFYEFVDRTIIFDSLKKIKDTLTIAVRMSVSNATLEENDSNPQEDTGLLLKSGENSDVIFISNDGKEHKAHKAILAGRSVFFATMFKRNKEEKQVNVVLTLKDLDSETLEAMLYFVYNGELLPSMKKLSKKLLVAADKYELTELKRMCISYLQANIDFDNVLDLINIAYTYDFSELMQKVKKYFLMNHKEIVTKANFESLRELPGYILVDLLHELSNRLSSK